MTLGEWLGQWLGDITGTIRPNTMTRYQGAVDQHIKPYLGDKPISQVKGKDIQRPYETLTKRENRNTGEGLSSGTVRGIHSMLHEALGAAQQASIIPRNPTEEIEAPKFSYKPKKVLTDKQLDKFMEAVRQDAVWYDFFYTELTTGLRRGELCGLRWEDFDGQAGTLQVRRTIRASKGGELAVGETKTYAGQRTILLPHSTAQLLRKRKKAALTQWLFPDPLRPGRPVNPGSAYRRLKELLKQAELPSLRFHDLRHTFATHALASGVDAKTLSGILGHTKASFTLDTYAHVTDDIQRQTAQVMDTFMTEIFGKGLIPWQSGESPAAAIRSAITSGKGGIHPEGRTASRAPGMSTAISRKSARRS